MQSDLLISIAANFLSGVCTEGTFIYIFLSAFREKTFLELDSDNNDYY